VAELSSSSEDKLWGEGKLWGEDKLWGFGATCVAGLSGHGGLTGHGGSRFGASCVAGLSGFGVEFWATALRTYPTTKTTATDTDLIRLFRRMVTAKPTPMTTVTSVIICGSAILTSTHCTASFDGGAESKTGHYLSSTGAGRRPPQADWPRRIEGTPSLK
jgi:hypothetical protein